MQPGTRKRVLVTGAGGFIGSHVTRALSEAGTEVAVIVRPQDPLKRLSAELPRLTVIRGDLDDVQSLAPEITAFEPEACIHLAWYTRPGDYLDSERNVESLLASLRLLKVLGEAHCRQVLMTGTCAEYDSEFGVLSEESPVKPRTLYAACKLSLRLLGQHLAVSRGISFAWARVFFLFGPDEDRHRLVPRLVNSLLAERPFAATAGDQLRDYLYVEDVASALVFLTTRQLSGIFNVCSGDPITLRTLMETIGRIMGRPHMIEFGVVPYRAWEPMAVSGDNRKLQRAGWLQHFSREDGLRRTIEWWQRVSAAGLPIDDA